MSTTMFICTGRQKIIIFAKRVRPRKIDVSARRRAKLCKPIAFASGGRAFVEMAEQARFGIDRPRKPRKR